MIKKLKVNLLNFIKYKKKHETITKKQLI